MIEINSFPIKLYSFHNYSDNSNINREKLVTSCECLEDFSRVLEDPEQYMHMFIEPKKIYTFFGDIDGIDDKINIDDLLLNIGEKLTSIISEITNDTIMKLTIDDISYTLNTNYKHSGMKSCHFVIPSFKCDIETMKYYVNKIISSTDSNLYLDLSVYKRIPFRLPGQYKGHQPNVEWTNGIHKVINGSINDFILIPSNDSILLIKNPVPIETGTEAKSMELGSIGTNLISNIDGINKDLSSLIFSSSELVKLLIDKCLTKKYYNEYDLWITCGMAICGTFGEKGYELFKYFSYKADKIKLSKDIDLIMKYKSFLDAEKENQLHIGTLFYYAKKENIIEYKNILSNREMGLEEPDIIKYIEFLNPNKFIWVKNLHYYYNGKYYVQDKYCSDLLNYMSGDLYETLKNIFLEIYPLESKKFNDIRSKLLKLKTHRFKEECMKTGLNMLRKDIEFDNNPDILPFNNVVYDLKEGIFRSFKYDDYVTITTGYDWEEPSENEINKINEIIDQILFDKETKDMFMTLLSSGLDGNVLQKFTILTGRGGNGKSWLKEILCAGLGNFYYKLSNSILDGIKSGADPNISQMNRKRLVFISEPKTEQKIDNSIIKELTGDKSINARALYSNDTNVKLSCTLMMDCNELPSMKNSATTGDERRIRIIPFNAQFTEFSNRINETKHIYKANSKYMSENFINSHKKALIKILMTYYKQFLKYDKIVSMSKQIEEETVLYLSQSDELSEILIDIIHIDENIDQSVSINDIYLTLPDKIKKNMTCRLLGEKLKKSSHYGDYYLPAIPNKRKASIKNCKIIFSDDELF
jgi:P4 family phage/plasmid primase-like protien